MQCVNWKRKTLEMTGRHEEVLSCNIYGIAFEEAKMYRASDVCVILQEDDSKVFK